MHHFSFALFDLSSTSLADADGSDPKEILAKNKHMLGTKKGVKKAMKLGVKVSLTGAA